MIIETQNNSLNTKDRVIESKNDSELRYRRLFETAQDGILILNANTGSITDVNPFLVNMLGFPRKEFIGKKLWQEGGYKDIEANQEAYIENIFTIRSIFGVSSAITLIPQVAERRIPHWLDTI